MAHILSLDLGTSHIGVAVYTDGGGTFSLNELAFDDKFQLVDKITTLIEEYSISVVVVGDMGKHKLPRLFNFVLQRLQDKTSVTVSIIPEHLSTKQVEKNNGSHSQAAVEILTDYLGSV
ncbi:pre-16S rRNA-processing nuclease YqgF [bacterium]|uniref:YqgF/RNase H-like domain-containing protein n=2 Tax=Katanobacteria TaxID=422282 RepID=A0A2M7X4W8_UNCKA|nr:pre-16S rRNA-processing nuclease YqgF [bacterium]PIP56201.1 MAG: hypothetical protein COX05_04245 [candidate division WWE3 bacterium CG22_combo_CG10-13_8_21_14_all_39_12]PJA41208.1 MAG: hypothetical protein CO179_00370 [candidate division WWE3 bacterium CG_4_9_14_3_um_filter_39_7]